MMVPESANQKCTSTSFGEYIASRFHIQGTSA